MNKTKGLIQMTNYNIITIDDDKNTTIEKSFQKDIDIKDKTREDIKRIIQSYFTDFYNLEDAEITIEEVNSMYNLLTSIAHNKIYNPIIRNPMSEETKKKISNSCKGKKRSEETKERMRQNSRRINVYQYDKNTGEYVTVWASTHEAAEKNNYNQSSISKACRVVRKSAYGYSWSYNPLGAEDIKLRITIKKAIKKKEQEKPLQQTFVNHPLSDSFVNKSVLV